MYTYMVSQTLYLHHEVKSENNVIILILLSWWRKLTVAPFLTWSTWNTFVLCHSCSLTVDTMNVWIFCFELHFDTWTGLQLEISQALVACLHFAYLVWSTDLLPVAMIKYNLKIFTHQIIILLSTHQFLICAHQRIIQLFGL